MTYSRAISFNITSTRSSRAAASPARAFVPCGHSSARIATTLWSAARVSRIFRIIATRRAIFCGLPSDSAKMSAATSSAADSSEMVKSGWCFRDCKGALQSRKANKYSHACTRKGKGCRTVGVNQFSRGATSGVLAHPLTVSTRPVPVGAGRVDHFSNSISNTVISAAFQRGSL